jgi:hypothetical protein
LWERFDGDTLLVGQCALFGFGAVFVTVSFCPADGTTYQAFVGAVSLTWVGTTAALVSNAIGLGQPIWGRLCDRRFGAGFRWGRIFDFRFFCDGRWITCHSVRQPSYEHHADTEPLKQNIPNHILSPIMLLIAAVWLSLLTSENG